MGKLGAAFGSSAPIAPKVARVYASTLIKGVSKSKLPRVISVIVDRKTGKVFTGKSGGLKGKTVNEQLKKLLPKESLKEWSTTNCAECEALNNALNAGAKLENMEMHTLQIDKKTGTYIEVNKCANCEITTKDIKTTSQSKGSK